MALGIRSVSELATRSGVSRSATTAAEHGEGARGTYERLEAWLAALEAGDGEDAPQAEPAIEQIEIVFEGRGVKLTMKAPIGDPDAAEAMAARLMRLIRDEG